jgi:hypothetical protein
MRRLCALVLLMLVCGAVAAQEPLAPRPPIQALLAASPATPLPLAALFAASAAITRDRNGESMQAQETDVLVARRNDDGSRSILCVSSEAAARAFLQHKTANAQAATPAPKE